MKQPFIVGHRGVCFGEPENTVKAFQKALDLKVDMIEMDVRLTKDNVPVVIHDLTVDRTTNGKGKVCELTLEQLKKLDAGDGQQIPTLQEVIDLLKGKAELVLELKTLAAVKPVAKLIKQNKIVDSTTVISFGHIIAKRFKALIPSLKTGVLMVSIPIDPLKIVKDAKADFFISFHESLLAGSLIYKKMIKRANKEKIMVFATDVDEKCNLSASDLNELRSMGVNGFICNRPDIAMKHLNGKKKKRMFW